MARRPVDEKIIRLKMDNSDLEDKASKSVALITKLKDTLNKIPGVNIGKVGDSLGKIGSEAGRSTVGLAAVADSVDQIAERFSTMGIVGTEVLRRVTNTGLDMVGNLAKKAWNQTVTAGKNRAKNIEQAAFQFKGLGMDVEKAMAAANYATTGTTFGLDEAALAASSLGASGVEAGDDMATALRSISGVAAMTNSSYSDTARIFTTVAGQGRLMTDQLNQFANRGLNVAAMMAKEWGMTENQVREMVSAGEVSFTAFYETMDELFGEHAVRNRETFDGAMAAMKSTFTRIGETLWVPILTHSRESLLTIMDFMNKLHAGLKPIVADLEPYVEKFFRSFDKFLSGIDLSNFAPTLLALYNGLKNIATAVGRIVGPIINAFRALVDIDGAPILGLAKAFEWLTSKLILPVKYSELFEKVLTSVTSTVNSTVTSVVDGVKRAFTALKDIPGLMSKMTNKFVEGSVAAGKWIGDIFINITDKIKQFAEYLKTLDTGKWLGDILSDLPFEKLGKFGENLSKLATVFEHQFFVRDNNLLWSINNTLRIALESLGVNFDGFDKMVSRIEKTWNNFLKIFKGIDLEETFSGGFLKGMASLIDQIITNIDKLTNAGTFLKDVGNYIDKLASTFKGSMTELKQSVFPELINTVKQYVEQLQISTNSVKEFITDLYNVIISKLTPAWNVFKDVMGKISLEPLLLAFRTLGRMVINVVEPIWELIKDIYNNITWEDVFAGGFLVGLGLILDNMKESFGGLKEIWDKVSGFFGKGADVPDGGGPISVFLESISGSLSDFSDTMKEGVSIGRIVAVATAIGIMAFAFSELSDLDTQQIANGMVAISTSIFVLSSGLKALDFLNLEGVGSVKIIAFATAMKIITGTLKSVGELDPTTIGAGAVGLASAMGILVGSLKLMDGVNISIDPISLIAMGVAIRIMAGTVLFAGNMSGETLLKGTATIGLLLAEFGLFGHLMDGINISPKSIASLYLVSGVLTIMTGIIGVLSFIDATNVAVGVAAIGTLLVALGTFGKLTEKVDIHPRTGLAVIGIATGLVIMSNAVKKLGELDPLDLVKGLSAVMIILLEVSTFSEAMKGLDMMKAAASIGVLALSLTLMVIPIKQFAGMDLYSLSQGLGAMALALLAMGLALEIVASPTALAGGAAFVLLAVAINLIIPPLEKLSGMEWGTLISSLGKFALAIGVITGVAALLGIAAPYIIGFATSLVVLGAGFSLIGISMVLFGTGLAALATLSVTTIAGAIASLGLFLTGLNKLLPALGRLIVNTVQLVIDIVLGLASTIIDAVLDVIYMLLAAIRDNLPRFIEVGVDILLALMEGLRDSAHEIANTAVELAVTLIDALAEAVNEHGQSFIDAVLKLFGAILVVVIAGIEAVMVALFGGIPGVKDYLEEKFGEATEAVREQFNLKDPVQEEMDAAKEVFWEEGPVLVEYAGGIADDASVAYNEKLLLEDYTQEETDAILEAWRLAQNPTTTQTGELGEGSTTSYVNSLLMGEGTQEEMDLIGANILKAKQPTGDNAIELAEYTDASFRGVDTSGAGEDFTRGIVRGMDSDSSKSRLWNVANRIGNSLLRTLNITLGNQSPSKYTTQSGKYLMEGLTLGMDSMTNKVQASASGMGQLALDATNSALNGALSEFDTEIRVKVVLDTSDFDNWNPEVLNLRRPDTSFTNGMIESSQPNYNQNEDKMDNNRGKESNEYNYDVHIHATGELPRSSIRRMAHDFKEEIENIDRRSRINRGEEVVY